MLYRKFWIFFLTSYLHEALKNRISYKLHGKESVEF